MGIDVRSALQRYIDEYGWSWNMARKLINRTLGTRYTEAELKVIYRQKPEQPPFPPAR